jgi:hypothetical protein
VKTLGSSSPWIAKFDRAETTGGKHATVMTYADDPRATRADVMMARNWVDQDRDEDREYRQRRTRSAAIVNDDIRDGVADDFDESEWDEIADVICAGRGRIGLAVAVAARRAGLDVMLTDGPAETAGDAAGADTAVPTGELAALLGVTDEETAGYLDALTEDIVPLPGVDSGVTVRVVDGPLHPELTRGPIGTFFGAALIHWAEACVSSPYGLLYTRVADPRMSVTYTGANGSVDATVLDTIDIDPDRPADSLEHWLTTLEHEHDDALQTSGSLQRLVFEDGVVVGAVVESASGIRTVRARHGVMMALGDGVAPTGLPTDLDRRESAEVALVSRAASRFARLELLTRAVR